MLSSPVCQTCLIDLYRKMTEQFRLELFDDSDYCNLGNDWSHWTLTGFPFIPLVRLVNSVKVVIIIHSLL